MTSLSYRRVLFGALVVAALALAFYVGGAVGFNQGFVTGYEIASISDAHEVVQALRLGGSTPRRGDLLLEGMVDGALTFWDMKQKQGTSVFDVIGVNGLDRSVESNSRAIIEHRRKHPSPMRQSGAPTDAQGPK